MMVSLRLPLSHSVSSVVSWVEKVYSSLPTGWIEQPTSSLRVTRSTTELNGQQLSEL